MNWELILLLTALMLFSYWLNYIMGSPLADKREDVDIKAILFDIPNSMAINRLKEMDVYKKRAAALISDLTFASDPVTKQQTRLDHKLDDYIAGREFFTWERSILCPICFHWWLSVIAGIVLLWGDTLNARADFFQAALAYLVLHLIIRKIS